LTTAISPGGAGSVTANPLPDVSGTLYTAGTVVTLMASANTDNVFDSWSGDASGNMNPTTVTLTANKYVIANFASCYSLSTSATPSGGGSVGVNPAPNCNNGTQYLSGTIVTLTATANSGYVFTEWRGNASGNTNPTTVAMTFDLNVNASFFAPSVFIDSVNPPAPYCVLRNSTNPYERLLELAGTNFLTPVNHQLEFLNVTSGDVSLLFDQEINWESQNRITVDMGVIASLLWSDSRLPLRVRYFTYTDGDFQPISDWSPQFILADDNTACGVARTYSISGQVTDISGNPLSGVNVADTVGHSSTTISDGTYVLSPLPAGTYTISSAKSGYAFSPSSLSVTVPPNATGQNFTALCFTFSTTVSPSHTGTVNVNPAPNCNNGTQYAPGTVITLTATANRGYAFTQWSGDANGNKNPTTVTMTANKNVTANFASCYSLSTSANPRGGAVSASTLRQTATTARGICLA